MRFRRTLVLILALAASAGFAASARASNVALFYNGTYVDLTGEPPFGDEGPNELASLQALGHNVTTFTDISAAGFAAAAAGKDVLVIPELEKHALATDLSAEAKAAIADFVARGGTLVTNGSDASRNSLLLNAVFGLSLTDERDDTLSPTMQPGAAGTEFAGGPGSLAPADGDTHLIASSLPPGSRDVYGSGADSSVAIMYSGLGSIVWLGWDWFDSNPPDTTGADDDGGQDGGWQATLNAAVSKPALTVTDASVVEGNTGQRNLSFTVLLSQPASEVVSVQFATANGTATAPSDYTATSGTLAFARGETSKTVNVPVNGDTGGELNETLALALLNPAGADIGRGTATGTILNDDGPVRDALAPGVQVSGVPKSLTLAKLLKGFKVSETSTEPTSAEFDLLGSARQVTLAKALNLTLASKRVRLGSGKRTVKIKPSKRLLKNARKRFSVQLHVVATDAAGNAKTVNKTIKIKR